MVQTWHLSTEIEPRDASSLRSVEGHCVLPRLEALVVKSAVHRGDKIWLSWPRFVSYE